MFISLEVGMVYISSGSSVCWRGQGCGAELLFSLIRVRLFVTPWTVACQASRSLGILQVGILEGAAMPSSRESSQPRDGTQVCCIAGRFFTI